MMQVGVDFSLILFIVIIIILVASVAMARRYVFLRISVIVFALIGMMAIFIALIVFILLMIFGSGFVVGLDKLPILIIVLIVVVGIISFYVYDKALHSQRGLAMSKIGVG